MDTKNRYYVIEFLNKTRYIKYFDDIPNTVIFLK